ncbi:hypothetical protein CfE428DRAFT_3264 [Chthoniobacter flavus Ellin428]|uniref:DUF6799 domain-containing protein n=1 Tax=Chthoniobacter flavus Ellin428 TaxID=497964 RepID=B4D2X6_9BACT|nr:DUF6799 domain-containing protein [Chthoniobacter flavus]EDY19087.1 hypothetical protein CfE428DRAFT_3264 [Chthoniobacter flavus Ellin428]TCO86848.1 hypothetical protein EV701_12665 [Chthoniobacter flavus]
MKANFLLCGLACALSVASIGSAEDVTRNPAAAGSKVEVGVARRDGITVSGGEAYVTRNGVTKKLVKDLKLPSGVTIQTDGDIVLATGGHASLQADQLLTLDGRITDIPKDPNVNPAPPVTSTATATTAAPATANATTPGNASANTGLPVNGGYHGTFIGSDGVPFVGTITAPGVITKENGTTIPIDGSIQALNPGASKVPTEKQLNPNGIVATPAGTLIFPDGSVRTKDGTIILPEHKQGTTVLQSPPPGTGAQKGTFNPQFANPNQTGGTALTGPRVNVPHKGSDAPENGTNGPAPVNNHGDLPAGPVGR